MTNCIICDKKGYIKVHENMWLCENHHKLWFNRFQKVFPDFKSSYPSNSEWDKQFNLWLKEFGEKVIFT